jgi:hypothetical protein
MDNGWDSHAARIWFLEKAVGCFRSGERPKQGRFLAECALTLGSYNTLKGFQASLRPYRIDEVEALAEVRQLSKEMRR